LKNIIPTLTGKKNKALPNNQQKVEFNLFIDGYLFLTNARRFFPTPWSFISLKEWKTCHAFQMPKSS